MFYIRDNILFQHTCCLPPDLSWIIVLIIAPVNTQDLKNELTTLQRPMAIKSCKGMANTFGPLFVEECRFEFELKVCSLFLMYVSKIVSITSDNTEIFLERTKGQHI